MEKGDALPEADHVLRYVGGNQIDRGRINGAAFLCRKNEASPSINWLECFPGDLNAQIAEVRRCRRINYGATARLARLNVGFSSLYVSRNDPNSSLINFISDPLDRDTEGQFPEDPSHSLIIGVPTIDSPEGELVGDLLAECVIESFLART
jgi:hypothetical protein